MRLRRGWGFGSDADYRGLRPDSRLVMTQKGQAFELAYKHRDLEFGLAFPAVVGELLHRVGIWRVAVILATSN